MYEMEGPCPASPHRLASCLALPHSAPPAGARYPYEGPVSRLLPRSRGRPRWCPFPNGDNLSTASAGAAQDPAASHFTFFRYSQRNPRETGSYPHLTAVIHRLAHSMCTGSRL
jgi:hypothetical protein